MTFLGKIKAVCDHQASTVEGINKEANTKHKGRWKFQLQSTKKNKFMRGLDNKFMRTMEESSISNTENSKPFIHIRVKRLEGCSVVKSTCYSSRGPGFSSHIHITAHTNRNSISGDSGTPEFYMHQTHMGTYINVGRTIIHVKDNQNTF